YWDRYPPGTVHLVVVDPGVGTDRRALACAGAGRYLVGPDNGVLTPALAPPRGRTRDSAARCVEIRPDAVVADAARAAPTFHGRDLFAPAAAALAGGASLDTLGAPVHDPVLLPPAPAARHAWGAAGLVVAVDRFGNLTTSLPGAWAA